MAPYHRPERNPMAFSNDPQLAEFRYGGAEPGSRDGIKLDESRSTAYG
jgi:hypothetical protein